MTDSINIDPSIFPSSYDSEKRIGLKILNCISRPAIIAGGAPRNWVLGSPAKDIDIYIKEQDGDFWRDESWLSAGLARPIQAGPAIGSIDVDNQIIAPGTSGSQKGIKSVHDLEIEGKKFQFITVKASDLSAFLVPELQLIKYICEAFDFGINKIIINKSGEIHRDYDFNEDVKNKTLTMRICHIVKYNAHAIPARFNKMKKYFPDHQVVIK